jgi:LPXTG-motif cell wall-anchored protein
MKRLVLTLILAATALVGASVVAPAGTASAQYPPGSSSVIRINVSSVRSTEPFTVTIGPCIPGETVIFRFRNQTSTTTCAGTPPNTSASATFIPRIRPNGLVDRSLGAQALVAQAPVEADVPAPGIYEVCGDLTGTGVTVPPGTTRPTTLCTQVEVLADAPPATTVAPVVTSPGSGLPATGSNGLGTTTTSGIVLLSAGALLLIVAQVRRRRTTTA